MDEVIIKSAGSALAFIFVGLAGGAIWFVFSFIKNRISTSHAESNFFGTLQAKLFVFLSCFLLTFLSLSEAFAQNLSERQRSDILSGIQRDLSRNLPQQLSDGFILENVIVAGNNLIYGIRVNGNIADRDGFTHYKRNEIRSFWCGTPAQRRLMDMGIGIVYQWIDGTGTGLRVSIRSQDC